MCLPCNADWSDTGGCGFGASPVVGKGEQQCHLQESFPPSSASPGVVCRRCFLLQAPVQAPLQAPFAALFQVRFRCHVRRTPKAPIQALHQALFKAGFNHYSRRCPWKRHLGAVHSSWRAPLRLFLPLNARQLQSLECYRC